MHSNGLDRSEDKKCLTEHVPSEAVIAPDHVKAAFTMRIYPADLAPVLTSGALREAAQKSK